MEQLIEHVKSAFIGMCLSDDASTIDKLEAHWKVVREATLMLYGLSDGIGKAIDAFFDAYAASHLKYLVGVNSTAFVECAHSTFQLHAPKRTYLSFEQYRARIRCATRRRTDRCSKRSSME